MVLQALLIWSFSLELFGLFQKFMILIKWLNKETRKLNVKEKFPQKLLLQ